MPSSPSTPSGHTRDALLDAAEGLFAEHGIQGASLRAITRQAGVNLAAVSYHFGSKEGLVRAVFERRMAPIQAERLARLEACLEAAGDGPPTIECLLRAFLEPVVCFLDRGHPAARDGGAEPQLFARLLGRSLHEPSGDTRAMLKEMFRPALEAFVAAAARARPELSRQELFWRFHFTVGSMAQTVALADVVRDFSGGGRDRRRLLGRRRGRDRRRGSGSTAPPGPPSRETHHLSVLTPLERHRFGPPPPRTSTASDTYRL